MSLHSSQSIVILILIISYSLYSLLVFVETFTSLTKSNNCNTQIHNSMIIEGKRMETEIINYILKNKEKHYRLAYSYVKNKEDALDIVQDAILKALKYQNSLKDIAYLNTWFYKIIINTAKTHLQKQNRYIDMEDDTLESYKSPIYDQYKHFELEDALEQLSYKEKTIITLRYFNQFELKEVADITEQNLSTVKSTLYRSLKKLKLLLEKE